MDINEANKIIAKTEGEDIKVDYEEFSELKGKVFAEVKEINGDDGDEIHFIGDKSYRFFHDQGCCESVVVEDICGDLNDLVGEVIQQAEMATHEKEDGWCESHTWTFYRFGTIKGSVTIRWHGTSNGYYSERVDFEELENSQLSV